MATNEWNPAMLSKLKSLVAKGLSTAEIGKKLGITKNSVVGKLNRLGWNAKATTTGEKPKATKPSTAKTTPAPKSSTKSVAKPAPKKVPTKPTAKPAAATKPVSKPVEKQPVTPKSKASAASGQKNLAMHQRIVQHSLELASLRPDQCRWPIGDPDSEGFLFCGEPVFVGKPYCYEHCKQAYQFAPTKTKK